MGFPSFIGNFLTTSLPGFAGGVIASLLAAYLYGILQSHMNRAKVPLAIEGIWGEFVPDSEAHQYSLGSIYYDKARGFYAFDGTNYKNNGDRYCHWETITSHIDVTRRKYFYLFTAQIEGALDTTYYGFGVVNLGEDGDGKLIPIDGHYISANVDGRPMSHSMRKAEAIGYDRRANGAALIEWLNGGS